MDLGLAHSGVLAGPLEERARRMSARPLRGPVLGHFGTTDEFIPEPAAQELEAELRQAGVDTDRLGTYDPDAANRSWRLTLEFLRGALA